LLLGDILITAVKNMEATYSNVIGVPQALDGAKSFIIDEAHFTEEDCNVTADGTLNICCPIKFKEGFNFDGDICDLDGNATFKGFTAQRSTGYNLVEDTATCANLGTARTTNCLVGMVLDATANISTRLQAQPTPSSLNSDGYIIIYHPDATHTPALNTGRSLEIRGGSGLNTDILMLADGDLEAKMDLQCNADLTLYSRGLPTAPGGGFGNIEIRAGYGEINLTAYGNGPYPGDHHNINIISQQGDVKITPRTPPNTTLTPPVGYTYITSLVSTDQAPPAAPYSGPAGQIRVVQDPAGNVYLYASTLVGGIGATQWSRVLLS
jgi:hypothetical protein